MSRGGLSRLAAAAAALLLAVAACGGSAPTGTSRVYFYRVPGEGATAGSAEGLIPVARTIAAGDATAAVRELLNGPTSDETAAGISSAIPAGTSLRSLTVADGIATIDLSASYDDGGGSMSMFVRLTQLVYTATQFPEITGVTLQLEGTTVKTFSSEGLEIANPMRRSDGIDQVPAIFLDSPAYGSEPGNPIELSGLANVFEAQFRVQLLNAAGTTLAEVSVMADCGTGCWGEFTEVLPYSVPAAEWGTLRAYEPSAKDGSPINVVEYRVHLTPAATP